MNRYATSRLQGVYRSRNGIVLGVCKGLADAFNLRVFWIRVIYVALLLVSGLWPMLAIYFIASLLMKPEPVRPFHNEAERDFYDSYLHSRRSAASRLKRRFDNLEKRIRRMEDRVTSREFEWEYRHGNGDL